MYSYYFLAGQIINMIYCIKYSHGVEYKYYNHFINISSGPLDPAVPLVEALPHQAADDPVHHLHHSRAAASVHRMQLSQGERFSSKLQPHLLPTSSLELELIIKDFCKFKPVYCRLNLYLFVTSGVLLDHPGSRLFVFPAVCQLLHQVLSRLRLRLSVKV